MFRLPLKFTTVKLSSPDFLSPYDPPSKFQGRLHVEEDQPISSRKLPNRYRVHRSSALPSSVIIRPPLLLPEAGKENGYLCLDLRGLSFISVIPPERLYPIVTGGKSCGHFFRSMNFRSQSLGTPAPFAERITEDPITYKTAQSTVTCVYQTHISGFWRNVTVLWSKNLMNHYLTIAVASLEGDMNYSCKVDLKPWYFWSKKGYKTLEVEGSQVEVFWDFRSAKFAGGPEPCSDYYVALVSDEEVVLLLGDYKKKAYKRTKSRPALVEAFLSHKKENVFGKKSFSTRARFDDRRREHEIVVESSTSGPKDPEMWISIDGIVMIHVKNLQWKFRGNQTVLLDKQPIQVLWDVHDWLFNTPGTGHGLFIFKPGSAAETDAEGSGHGRDSDTSNNSRNYSIRSNSAGRDFCLFLYAWKLE